MTTKPIPEGRPIQDIPSRLKPSEFEAKWQKVWEEQGTYRNNMRNPKKPYYNLMMFPYPSAEGLHVGNMYAFTGVDVHGRFKRMQGYDVFEPIGLDGFGIHSENYAIKVGRKPQEHAAISEKNFYRQLRATGNGYDWTRTVETYDPDYYRWTQWLFVQMFKHGLAYRAKATVNWCPACKTVLADEQVIDGLCERCSSIAEKKELEQWFFKITEYAERLLQNTYKTSFKWPEKVKIGQRNWIGKKEGINITYQVKDNKEKIICFTTTPVNFAATFLVLAPEHPAVKKLTTLKQKDIVDKYIDAVKKMKKEDRIAKGKEKTGVFSGSYAINHVTNESIPIWISDFVLSDVGTGAIQACPGHDIRDFEFAIKFELPIKRVVVGPDGDTSPISRPEQVIESGMPGKMINSEFLNGMEFKEAMVKTMDYFEAKGWAKRVVSYHMRDWLISRQRYWGAPIPMVFCEACYEKGLSWFHSHEEKSMNNEFRIMNNGNNTNPHNSLFSIHDSMKGWFPVPEKDLPVKLPEVENWRPTGTGRGPLAAVSEFYETTCPNCSGPAKRETDVCDTFLDSSWYYLRYPSVGNQKSKIKNQNDKEGFVNLPWDIEVNKNWLPVDSYIGGAEHTVLHLLYTRFTYMALKDWGYIKFKDQSSKFKEIKEKFDSDEPFKRFYAHGLIIKDGAKMSKSKGNVVVPDEYIKLYGADTLRTYLMFLGPFDAGGDFRDSGIAGMYKWLSRVWRLTNETANSINEKPKSTYQDGQKLLHKTIKSVTVELTHLRFNTSIAKLMEFTNWWMERPEQISKDMVFDFLKLLAPFAPHLSEELWQQLKVAKVPQVTKVSKGGIKTFDTSNTLDTFSSIHKQPWPIYDPQLVIEETVAVVIQINGKVRDSFVLAVQDAKNQTIVEQKAKSSAKIVKWLGSGQIKKTIFVPGKLINYVI